MCQKWTEKAEGEKKEEKHIVVALHKYRRIMILENDSRGV